MDLVHFVLLFWLVVDCIEVFCFGEVRLLFNALVGLSDDAFLSAEVPFWAALAPFAKFIASLIIPDSGSMISRKAKSCSYVFLIPCLSEVIWDLIVFRSEPVFNF